MNRSTSILPHLLLASAFAFALSAFGAAPALSEPPPAPAARDLPDPLHPCTVLLCLPPKGGATLQGSASSTDAATGTPAGKRMHKPYTVTAPAAVNPGDTQTQATIAQPGACAATTAGPLNVASDPEEGGQVTAAAKTKPTVSDINVMKTSDKASANLAPAAGTASGGCGSTQP